MSAYAAISLNLDSLAEAYGYPEGYRDPTFFDVMDRFLALADRYGFRYSIAVIGRDLETPEHRARVRAWHAAGHEIVNHSHTHSMAFGTLPRAAMHDEVLRAHDAITETIGEPPVGFIAPSWNASPALYEILTSLGYTHDTSAFPSWVLLPALVKNRYNYRGNPKGADVLRRRDWGTIAWGPRCAHRRSGVVVLPMPTNALRIACWHTLGFVIGWTLHGRLLRSCLRSTEPFTYVIHPADLMDARDLDPHRPIPLERLREPLAAKLRHLERVIATIRGSGRTIVTLRDLAARVPV